MKTFVGVLLASLVIAGCANAPVAMKADRRYFTPIKTFAQKPQTAQSKMKFTSSSLQKELSEKNVMIDLLTKENQQLRERVARLEKRLSITRS